MDTRPIIMSSVFKSGTWMLRHIISEITQLEAVEPEIGNGTMDPGDPDNIFCSPGHFFSWHFIPTEKVCKKLLDMNARPVFLLRNVYDLAVSMYYHFAQNIDFEIGRNADKHEYFAGISKSEGITQIIAGNQSSGFRWKGLGMHVHQMERMLAFSKEYPCHIATYERLVQDKTREIGRLSRYLGIELDSDQMEKIAESSSFSAMKAAAEKHNIRSHFRKGKMHSHVSELDRSQIHMIANVLHEYAPELERLARETGIREVTVSALT
jgi:hypothetical protein